jgi:hypothetical protein
VERLAAAAAPSWHAANQRLDCGLNDASARAIFAAASRSFTLWLTNHTHVHIARLAHRESWELMNMACGN